MNRTDRAVACFKQGNNCSMSVFSAFAPDLGVDEKTAFRIAAPFGGGMAKMGGTCGAVTGAFMVLGLAFEPRPGESALERKQRLYDGIRAFAAAFASRNRSITCREILGCDISTPEGDQLFREKGLINTTCVKCVRDAAELLEERLPADPTTP